MEATESQTDRLLQQVIQCREALLKRHAELVKQKETIDKQGIKTINPPIIFYGRSAFVDAQQNEEIDTELQQINSALNGGIRKQNRRIRRQWKGKGRTQAILDILNARGPSTLAEIRDALPPQFGYKLTQNAKGCPVCKTMQALMKRKKQVVTRNKGAVKRLDRYELVDTSPKDNTIFPENQIDNQPNIP